MKILVIGHSADLGKGLGKEHRFTAVVARTLRREFPDRSIEVETELWGYISAQRIGFLADRIATFQPDYLLLDPSPVWVTFPMVGPAIRRRLPVPIRSTFYRLTQAGHEIECQILQRHSPALFQLYQRPLGLIARTLVDAAPVCEVSDALHFMERVILTAKSSTAARLVVLSGQLSNIERYVEPDTLKIIRHFIPEGSEPRLKQLENGISALCERHGCLCLDGWSMLFPMLRPESFLADGVHLNAKATNARAAGIARALAELEASCATPDMSDLGNGIPARTP